MYTMWTLNALIHLLQMNHVILVVSIMKLNISLVVVYYKVDLQMQASRQVQVVKVLEMITIVGVLMETAFLNGESMGMAFENIKIDGKLRIAVTAQGQKLRIKVGDDNMKFSPL